jgi:ABC-type Fe3+/spermidine/putrescine transport system ATPase subunit
MLEVIDIQKSYEGQPLLRGVSFTVDSGETVCLLGASGSGKSTLLRLIGGLEVPEQGQIRWQGQDLAPVPAHRRGFGLMFQDYALFPHLTVAQNVAFGLKMQNLPASAIQERVAEMLARVDLEGFGPRGVTDLSGGEQQRVALARLLAPGPRLLMFDEPLGALDRALKEDLLGELRRLLHESAIPAIYVTHDQEEASSLADRLLLLHDGCIVQSGTPAQVWAAPASAWAARFLGAGNVIEGVVRSAGCSLRVETAAGPLEVACGHAHTPGQRLQLLVRSSGVARRLNASGGRKAGVAELHGRVADILFQDGRYRVTLESGLFFYLDDAPRVGEPIVLTVPQSAIQCLP